jgi:hypothetical protein
MPRRHNASPYRKDQKTACRSCRQPNLVIPPIHRSSIECLVCTMNKKAQKKFRVLPDWGCTAISVKRGNVA